MQVALNENSKRAEFISFTQAELNFFVKEILNMEKLGEKIDIPKALHYARYLSKLDERIENMRAGHYIEFTDDEWEYFTKEAERLDNSCPERIFNSDVVIAAARRFAMVEDYKRTQKHNEE